MILSKSKIDDDGEGGGSCWSVDDVNFLYPCPNHNLIYSCVFVVACRCVSVPGIFILSLVTVSLTVLVSVTGFFFTTTSSLTNGFLVTSTSSLFNSTLISVFDFTGPSEDKESLAGLLSTT